MRKLIAFLCALSILISCSAAFAEEREESKMDNALTEEEQERQQNNAFEFETDEENQESISDLLSHEIEKENVYINDEAVSLMISLGVLESDDDMNKNVTRAEFAHALYIVSGYEYTSSSAVGFFTDIGITTPYYNEISVLKDHNIISGYADSKFRPDSDITVYEASKMLVCLMGAGWIEAVRDRAGFSYYNTASDKKLFKGINDLKPDNITYKQMAYMLLNMLECETEKYPDKNAKGAYMNNVLHIYKTDGIFINDSRTDDKGFYTIGGNQFKKPQTDYSYLLGQRTVVYYRDEDNEQSILSMTAHQSQQILDLQDNDIEGYDRREYKYRKDGGSVKRARLQNAFDIIYNGVKVIGGANTEGFMMPDMGTVRLIDNDNDGKYEFVIIWDYKLFIVDSYSGYNNILSSENNQKQIDLSEDKAFDILMAGTDNELSSNQIAYNKYILSVARSINDEYVKIYLCAETVSGAVTNVDTSNRKIKLDGKEYEYEKCMDTPPIVNGEFYKDQFGRLIYMREGTDIQKRYAYIIKMYDDRNTDKFMMRLYTQDNQKLDAPVSDKVTIDGRNVKGIDNIMIALDGMTGTVIKFMINSKQEITFIDTKNNNQGKETEGLNVCYEATARVGFNATCMALCDYDTAIGKCPIKLESIVFCVMEPYSDDNIWVYSLTDFKNKYATHYGTQLGEVVVYNSDPDSYVGDVILNKRDWMGNSFTYSTSVLRSGAVVTGISECADDFGEINAKLTVERGGKTEEIIIRKEAMNYSDTGIVNTEDTSKNVYTVSKGDIIRWRLGTDDMINKTGINVIYDCDRDKFFYENGKNSYTKGTTSESGRWNRLWLYKRDGEHLISYNADMISLDNFDETNIDAYKDYRYVDYMRDVSTYKTEVWIYDKNINVIEKGSIADFDYYVNSGKSCGEVLSFLTMMHRFFLIYR